jgi:uncharacterized YccA/Bax inhibitor family protein
MKLGFLDESEGVRSSTRLLAFILVFCVVAVIAVICIYTLHTTGPSATVIGALGGVVTALVAQGIVAIAKRNTP